MDKDDIMNVIKLGVFCLIVSSLISLFSWAFGLDYTQEYVAPIALGLQDISSLNWTKGNDLACYNYALANPNWFAIILGFAIPMVILVVICHYLDN